MAAVEQLSDAQQSFLRFCSVLQELILNHQVAHSVVQELHADLPTLQPQGGSMASAITGPSSNRSGGTGRGSGLQATCDALHNLAPRLTPTPAAASTNARTASAVNYNNSSSSYSAGGALSSSSLTAPSRLVACETQDNYIVLQNAARKSQQLLQRLQELRQGAVAAVAAQREGSNGELGRLAEKSAKYGIVQYEGDYGSGVIGSVEEDVDVDIVLFPSVAAAAAADTLATTAATESGTGTSAHAAVAAADGGGSDAEGGPVPTSPRSCFAAGDGAATGSTATTAGTPPAPAAATSTAAPGGGGSSSGVGGAAKAAATASSWSGQPQVAAGAAAAAVGAPVPVFGAGGSSLGSLSGSELAILMGELCREVDMEVELLVRVAGSVALATSADDLYVYGSMLKLQPYMDERVLSAAWAQRDVLAPPAQQQQQGKAGRSAR
ncbi:hypothetical protein Agub_g3372 [Astrephomene gubernaculifera]|uniref:Uncharacterized protein n=1 Tax=Astrephomene gubernaculifera TaxID=47775 RepID=A0AAD3DIH0_9CHLO|nr:hypothetical protein Agub_g3372 [Astrephomene gubernaculifera]